MPTSDLVRLDRWIAKQPEPKPSRPEAIRRFVEKGLASEGVAHADAPLDLQIAEKEQAIAKMRQPPGPSPEAALAVMDKALAEKDLMNMKNKRARRRSSKQS